MSNRVSSSSSTSTMASNPMPGATTMVPHEKIAMRAYEKWCKRGCPCGTDKQDWLEAETELRMEMSKAGARR